MHDSPAADQLRPHDRYAAQAAHAVRGCGIDRGLNVARCGHEAKLEVFERREQGRRQAPARRTESVGSFEARGIEDLQRVANGAHALAVGLLLKLDGEEWATVNVM